MMLGTVCFAMALGLPVAFAFFGANIIGTLVFMGGPIGLTTLPSEVLQAIARFSLTPIPLFLLMGELMFQTGVLS